ncbi:zf-HC2 domain-containing protein [Nonomuraea sp. SYSU D8015]|uniref:zf-HC2 domain-containing protein n=1 Tax=Nonomuraea sp. SYSU D8015 TaxID=2593644 RepID=UPI0016612A26|nr:zf-HC2 domain-containing protein [Nonomuraea sp. SYSU D8015]
MRHDPERDAAAYLAGELGALRRLWFERHMLDCRDCWTEATIARQGRMLAESLRVAAPPSTRERIRAVAELDTEPQRGRWPQLLLAAAVAVLIAVALAIAPRLTQTQPAPLVAAADLQRAESLVVWQEPGPPLPRIGAYAWRGTAQEELGEMAATVYSYAAPDGRHIVVIASSRPFPRAAGARDVKPAPSWLAEVEGTSMLCADKDGTSWLAVAADPATALTVGRALGLTREGR